MVTCWTIWKACNAAICSDCLWEDWLILSKIRALQKSIHKAFGTVCTAKNSQEVVCFPPQENAIKVNVDGSSFDNPG